jgi:hypothetical protein
MGDSGLFVGYRIDCKRPILDRFKRYDFCNLANDLKDKGFKVDYCPSTDWFSWWHPSSSPLTISLLWLEGDGAIYYCPVDWQNLSEELKLNNATLDFPSDGNETIEGIKKTEMFQFLVEYFGADNVQVKWGIFKVLS